MLKRQYLLTVFFIGLNFLSNNAIAGIYTNQLAKCMIDSTSVNDRNLLVKWVFTAITLHPVLEPISAVTPEYRNKADKQQESFSTKY